jgi:hypothetical protein
MKLVLFVFVAVALCAAGAMIWQHLRYLDTRRDIVQDRQPLLYGSEAFHVVTFLRTAPGADVIEAVRKLKGETESFAGVRWVYAGKVALDGNASHQLGAVAWSAILLLQYPSREAYDQAARSESYRQALARFPETYSHGFERSPWFNLAIHQVLLARRVKQIVTREASNFPFVPVPASDLDPRFQERIPRLLSERELGARAVAIVNLIKHGTPEQRAADRGYTGRMLGAMAEGGYGPMHLGRAVSVEADHDFDDVVIVYYPGVPFFADMLRSQFFQGIIGGKQLGDTQSTITVPILELL